MTWKHHVKTVGPLLKLDSGTLERTLDTTPGRLGAEIREQMVRAGKVSSAA